MDLPILFWIAFYIWIGAEFVLSVQNKIKQKNSSTLKRDKGSFWLIIIGIWVGAYVSFQIHFNHVARIAPGNVLLYIGVILMVFGVLFRFYAIRILGRHFNLAVQVDDEQTIVQAGPYKTIRHPSYTGSLFTLIGFGIALNSWLALLVMFVVFSVIYGYRIKIEELVLVEHFGEAYEDYRKHTWRILPYIW